MRKIASFGVLLFGLMSCGDAQQGWQDLRSTFRPNAPRFHYRADTLIRQRPIPPRLDVSFPKTELTGVMLLETERDGIQTWLTADGATVTLDQGLVTTAKGFGSGLTGSDVSQSKRALFSGGPSRVERFHSFLNGNDEIELRAFICEFEELGSEQIFVLGNPVATQKVQEHCFGDGLEFKNTYWMNPVRSEILQSSQWTGDFLGNIAIKAVPE